MIFTVTIAPTHHDSPIAAVPIVADSTQEAMQEASQLVNAAIFLFAQACRARGVMVPAGMNMNVYVHAVPMVIPYRPGLAECNLGGPQG